MERHEVIRRGRPQLTCRMVPTKQIKRDYPCVWSGPESSMALEISGRCPVVWWQSSTGELGQRGGAVVCRRGNAGPRRPVGGSGRGLRSLRRQILLRWGGICILHFLHAHHVVPCIQEPTLSPQSEWFQWTPEHYFSNYYVDYRQQLLGT